MVLMQGSQVFYILLLENINYMCMHIFYTIMGEMRFNVSIIIAFDLGILNMCLPVFHLVVDSGEVSAAEVGLKYEILLSIHSYGLCSSL